MTNKQIEDIQLSIDVYVQITAEDHQIKIEFLVTIASTEWLNGGIRYARGSYLQEFHILFAFSPLFYTKKEYFHS